MKTISFYLRFGAVFFVFAVQVTPTVGGAQAVLPNVVSPPAGINLGSTSFYDGFGRLRPGLTVLQYFRWSDNTEISDANGYENSKFIAPRIEVLPALTQFVVATRLHPFGGTAGFSVLVPLVDVDASFAANSPKRLSDNGFGLGDIVAGPTYQSKYFIRRSTTKPLKRFATSDSEPTPYFAYRTQFLVQIPSGKFNPAKSINQGSGYWAVVPYVAATLLPTSKIEMSTRLHYEYNLPTNKLSSPPPVPHLIYKSGQAGQLVYGNFTASYRFTRRFYCGANSYGVYQLTPNKTNGVPIERARETQFYLGPGGGYDFSHADTLNVNVYLKLEAHNAASGPSLQLLYIHRF